MSCINDIFIRDCNSWRWETAGTVHGLWPSCWFLFGFMRVLIILKTCVQKLEAAVASQVLVAIYETP